VLIFSISISGGRTRRPMHRHHFLIYSASPSGPYTFELLEVQNYKLWLQRHLQWHDLITCLNKSGSPLKIYQHTKCHCPAFRLFKFCNNLSKPERPPIWSASRYGIIKYGFEVTFSDITCLLIFTKIHKPVQEF